MHELEDKEYIYLTHYKLKNNLFSDPNYRTKKTK